MQVLIIRHAPAENRKEFARTGKSDELRPLSEKGKAKMRENVQGLQVMVPRIHSIISSPLVRAQETADLLAAAYPIAYRDTLSALSPLGSPSIVLSYLQEHANTTHTIALVGHEPDLGKLATWLLSGHVDIWLPLKKGAACLLKFSDNVKVSQAELCWALTPKQLRKIAIV